MGPLKFLCAVAYWPVAGSLAAFQRFIDETWPYNRGQADFPMAPLKFPVPNELLLARGGPDTEQVDQAQYVFVLCVSNSAC